jgi:hypothetical protein
LDLKQRLPKVWKAMASGDIDLWRAKTIVYGTCHLGVDTAREVVDQIIGKAARLTTGQLNALLRKVCVQADPEEAASRYQHAVTERRVIMEANDTGTANLLGLDLPPHRVTAICAHITNIAKGLRGGGESRSMDQLKADILLDLLEGKTHQRGSRRGMVDITVDLDTLAGLSQTAGELSGFGPVIADIARQVTEQQHGTGWRWKVTHPDSGQPLHEGITRRRPNRGRRRSVEARNRTCVFPGCRMPATECDLDHRIPGRRVDRPGSATWHPSAGMTIIGSDTKPDGNTDCYPTATTSGPAASATPTPPAANRHNGREDVGVLLVTFERRALLTTPSQTPARQLHRPVVDR